MLRQRQRDHSQRPQVRTDRLDCGFVRQPQSLRMCLLIPSLGYTNNFNLGEQILVDYLVCRVPDADAVRWHDGERVSPLT
jgi:hypothetical protein